MHWTASLSFAAIVILAIFGVAVAANYVPMVAAASGAVVLVLIGWAAVHTGREIRRDRAAVRRER